MDEARLSFEREQRLRRRNERRRARGKPTWGPMDASVDLAPTPAPAAAGAQADASAAARRRLGISTIIFAVATGISRVVGLVREIVATYYFGARGPINAFTIAFQLPNLIRALVADAALSSAFVPVFSELLEKGQAKRAWRVASSLIWLILLGLGGFVALLMLAAPLLLRPFHASEPELAVGLARVLFPIVVLLGVSGIIVGILNSYDHFTVPALTPVVWNIAIIVGLVVGVPSAATADAKLYVYAGSILVATFIQMLLPLPWLRGHDDRLRVLIDWHDPAVWRVLKLMVPVTIGLGLININALIDTLFASRFINPNLAPTAINKAFLLYMVPQGMFSVAIATVLFPTLSRHAARGDLSAHAATVARGMRQIAFLLIPSSIIFAVLAEPIVRLLFQRGAFKPGQTTVVAGALAAFALGLTFNGLMLMLNRAFFSMQENWVPTAVALANLALNAVLDAVFYRFGVWGIPLSTAVVNIFGVVALVFLLRRHYGGLHLVATTSSMLRMVAAGAVLAVVAWPIWDALDSLLGRALPAQLVSLGLALALGVVAYIGSCALLRVREMQALLSLRGRET
ncbi:MAG TPA: murein biosynthesis integral membrane protein MurJ [Gaiellaceae bacterium]